MSKKRIMLFGAAGQVAQALFAEPIPVDWDLRGYTRAECDITNHHAVKNAMQEFEPELVINTAAMTAVDKCETEHDQARAVNFEAPANIAALCATRDIPMIHISTDYVFDGSDGEKPYQINDAMNPLSAYGDTKMMGEEALRHELAWHIILRVSSVFSAFGTNLLTKTIQTIDQRDEMKVVTDQKSCPTHAPEIAKALIIMTNTILKGKYDGFGTFHLCGAPPATRMEFVQAIMDAYEPYTRRRPTILPAVSADFPGFAVRPPYSVLDCTRIKEVYGIEQKPWRDGLAESMAVLMKNKKDVA